MTQKIVDTLQRYAETIYLTQTVEKKDGKLTRFLNLEDAFAAWETEPGPARMAHAFPRAGVPRRSRRRSAPPASPSRTRCAFHKAKPLSRQLEIETYTWDVLPDNLKTGDIVDYVCREIDWVRGQSDADTATRRAP